MKPTLKAGLVLGLAVELWVYVMGILGWYKDPVLLNFFWLVILIQIGVLIWGLRLTADGKTYGAQVGAGVLMSLVGGVIIALGSILFTTVVFPNYFEELRAASEEMMRKQVLSEEEIETQLDSMAPLQTPIMQAIQGFFGTLVTGLLASLVIAIFIRKKEENPPST